MRSDDVATKTAKQSKMGRPKLALDPQEVRERAHGGASMREIARALGCDETVIRTRFKADFEHGKDARKRELRELQMKAARNGNPALLIWLGKNELEQTDKVGHEHEGKLTIEVVYRDAPRTTDA
jgi:hypothetical protein